MLPLSQAEFKTKVSSSIKPQCTLLTGLWMNDPPPCWHPPHSLGTALEWGDLHCFTLSWVLYSSYQLAVGWAGQLHLPLLEGEFPPAPQGGDVRWRFLVVSISPSNTPSKKEKGHCSSKWITMFCPMLNFQFGFIQKSEAKQRFSLWPTVCLTSTRSSTMHSVHRSHAV